LVPCDDDRSVAPPILLLAIHLGVGMACVALLSVAAALCGVVWVAGVSAVPIMAYGIIRLIREARASRFDRHAGSGMAGAVILGAAWLIAWLWATIPPVFYDELVYHLVMPQRTLVTGELLTVPWNFFTLMPHASDLLLAWGIAVSGELGARAVHVTLWMVSTLGAWGLVEAVTRPKTGSLVAPLVAGSLAACPTLWFVATLPFAEACLSVALCAAMGLLAVSRGRPRPWAALGLVLGLAATAKLTGLYWAAAGLMAALVSGWRLVALAQASGIALISLLPWWVRAFRHTGDPIYPMAYKVLGGDSWTAENHARVIGDVAKSAFDMELSGLLRLPLDLVRHPEYFGAAADLGIVALFATAATLTWPIVTRLTRCEPGLVRMSDSLAAFVGVAGLAWLATSTTTRFFAPALVLGLTAVAGAVQTLSRRGQVWALLLMLAAGVSGTWRFLDQHTTVFSSAGVALGRESADHYLSRQLDHYRAARYVLERLPSDAKVLFIGETRTYYFFCDAVAPSAYDRHPLRQWVEESASPEALAKRLAHEGISHVVLNIREFNRLRKSYGLLAFTGSDAATKDRRLKELPRRLRLLFSENMVYVFEVPAL
ncbi:MAG: hypothetical protein ACRD3I_03965, partial [Terriglobales bacterium]